MLKVAEEGAIINIYIFLRIKFCGSSAPPLPSRDVCSSVLRCFDVRFTRELQQSQNNNRAEYALSSRTACYAVAESLGKVTVQPNRSYCFRIGCMFSVSSTVGHNIGHTTAPHQPLCRLRPENTRSSPSTSRP